MFLGGKNKNTITYHDMFCIYAYILIHLLAITGKEKKVRFWKGFWSLRFPGTHPFSMERLRMVMELKYITEEVIGQPNHSLTMRGHVCLAVGSTTFYMFPPKRADPRCKKLENLEKVHPR